MDDTKRVIEEWKRSDDEFNNEYILDITSKKILEVLDYLVLDDDHPDYIYLIHNLTPTQVEKLKPFLKEGQTLNINDEKYLYYLGAYSTKEYKGDPKDFSTTMESNFEWLGINFHEEEDEPLIDLNESENIKDLEKAALEGDVTAQSTLGELYSNPLVIQRDYVEAKKWFDKAAKQGDVKAIANLGYFYWNGHGLIENYKKAKKYLKKLLFLETQRHN